MQRKRNQTQLQLPGGDRRPGNQPTVSIRKLFRAQIDMTLITHVNPIKINVLRKPSVDDNDSLIL